jgi:hypothetical protein
MRHAVICSFSLHHRQLMIFLPNYLLSRIANHEKLLGIPALKHRYRYRICGGIAAVAVFVNNLYSLRKLKSDLRKADVEYEKITVELDDLKTKRERAKSPIAMATFADIEKYGSGASLNVVGHRSYFESERVRSIRATRSPKSSPPIFIHFLFSGFLLQSVH